MNHNQNDGLLKIIRRTDPMIHGSCDYNSIKILTALKFATVDYKDWGSYEPRDTERGIFKKCKAVADAFDEALCEQIE